MLHLKKQLLNGDIRYGLNLKMVYILIDDDNKYRIRKGKDYLEADGMDISYE